MWRWWLVQFGAGAVMVSLFSYQRWSVRRLNRLARIRLDEGFGLLSPREPSIGRHGDRRRSRSIP
jgi:hypothetical protein